MRRARLLGVVGFAVLQAGCGDPVVVLGDAPGYMRVVAGIGDSIGSRVDSVATRARMTEPSAVAFDANSGLLYVADRGALRQIQGITTRVARIFGVTSAGKLRLLMDAGGCSGGTVCLVEPTAMTLAADGTLLVTDGASHRVFRFAPASGNLVVVAGTGVAGASADGTPALQASLRRPAGIALGGDGTIYVSEESGNQVRRIDAAGVLRTVAGSGAAAHTGDGAAAVSAGVYLPTGLAVQSGQLYIAESGAHTIRRVDLGTGQIETVAGNQVQGFAGDGGPALQASFAVPQAVAVTAAGTLYVSDRDNHRVRVVNLITGVIATYAGSGATVFTGNRLPAGAVSLRSPRGLAIGGSFLYIADPAMHVVWRATIGL
jgi:sugar lactone lactonase YvrE